MKRLVMKTIWIIVQIITLFTIYGAVDYYSNVDHYRFQIEHNRA
jgi:dihydrodipicolinate synthase/N-acetylneuraminate lyase